MDSVFPVFSCNLLSVLSLSTSVWVPLSLMLLLVVQPAEFFTPGTFSKKEFLQGCPSVLTIHRQNT